MEYPDASKPVTILKFRPKKIAGNRVFALTPPISFSYNSQPMERLRAYLKATCAP
jgi:hypothetical protein